MYNRNRSFSDYLYTRPSWLSGIARLFDFWGLYDSYGASRTGNIADTKALYSDWRTVGHDLKGSLDRHAKEHRRS
jgi:hypothetical protein